MTKEDKNWLQQHCENNMFMLYEQFKTREHKIIASTEFYEPIRVGMLYSEITGMPKVTINTPLIKLIWTGRLIECEGRQYSEVEIIENERN